MSDLLSIPKIAIVVAQRHPRVAYALETIFSEFLMIDCRIVLAEKVDKARSDGFAVFSYLPNGTLGHASLSLQWFVVRRPHSTSG